MQDPGVEATGGHFFIGQTEKNMHPLATLQYMISAIGRQSWLRKDCLSIETKCTFMILTTWNISELLQVKNRGGL